MKLKRERETAEFIPVENEDGLQEWIARSNDAAVVVFLHDPWCPISGKANGEMKRVTHSPIALVDVSRQHALSEEVARQTGIRHESPQVIVLRDGKPIWDASHFAIKTEAVERILAAADSATASS